jgi:hypothetical protein
LGRRYFLEYRPTPAIVELVSLSRGWLLEDIYGPSNCRPLRATVRAIRRKLEEAGVLVLGRYSHGQLYSGVARLAGVYDLGEGNLDVDHVAEGQENGEDLVDAA